MKKLITFVTAASLLAGSMCTTAYAVTFADINTVTWSGFVPFIEEAAELGLMTGYDDEDGSGKKYCKPRNNVTYCEAVQLMYSVMKVYTKQDVSNAAVTKWKPVMSGYDIPSWAYKATAYALENEIIYATTANNDLAKLKGNGKNINVIPATREDVGVFFGRALDTINGYDIKSNAALSYKDKAKISAAAVPYLELLNRANLMVGDTDNNFNPKANISRAEMAVLSVKTYEKLTDGVKDATKEKTVTATVTGTQIMANNDLFLTVKTKDGAGLSLFADKDDVKPLYMGMKIDFADIGEGDTVKITYQGDQVKALEVTNSVRGIFTVEVYELKSITSSRIKVMDGTREEEFRLDDDVQVDLEGRNSTINRLDNALEDAKYDVKLVLDRDEYVLYIDARLNDKNPTEGYVDDVEDTDITLLVGSRTYTYPISDDVEIEYNGKTVRFSKLESDYDDYNYFVSLKLNKDYEVSEIQIKSMEDEYNGTLTRLTSKEIEFSAGRTTHKYSLDDSVSVKIDGKKSSVDALKESYRDDVAYTVTVELDRDDRVTSILAVSKYSNNNNGELKAIDAYDVTIIIDEKEYSYELSNDVSVSIDGRSRSLNDLIGYMGSYVFHAELGFNNSGYVNAIKAQMQDAAEGELRYIDEAEGIISIRAAGMTVKQELADNAKATLGGKDISLAALDAKMYEAYGSVLYVELEYNNSGKVKTITANWEDAYGELISVYEDDDEIVVKEDGRNETYIVDTSADFVYRLSSGVDEDKYRSQYDNDLDGLEDFLKDCEDAGDKCQLAMTLDGNEVVWIKATAE